MSVDLPADETTDATPNEPERLPTGAILLIGLLLASAFVVVLNETIMSVALPRLMADLQITASTAQWLTTGFMLTMAIVIPTTGFILERYALRTVFVAAMSLFSFGTLVSASAFGFPMLLVGRVLQASGTAVVMPLFMTTVLTIVPATMRGRIMGTISVVIAVAPAIGPTISGAILSVLDWRFMFWLVLPIGLISLGFGALKIENVTTQRQTPFDPWSVVVSAVAFGAIVFGLASIGEAAEGEPIVAPWIPLLVGVAALAVFIARQVRLQRRDAALLDLRTFRTPSFTTATVMVTIVMMTLFGTVVVLPIYLQNVLGLDTLTTGLLMLPGGAIMGLLSPVVGRLFDRIGPSPLVIPGALIVSTALWLLTTQLSEHTAVPTLVVIHSVLHIGLAMMFTPLLTSALGSLDSGLYSHGSAMMGTVQQLAGAAGTAIFVTLLSTGTAGGLADGLGAKAAALEGTHSAFLGGALMSLLAIVASLFIRRSNNATGHSAAH